PVFIPAIDSAHPDAQDVENLIDLGSYADPLTYWGCTSRTAISKAMLSSIPGGHTRIDELQLDLVHPAGWQLSKFTMAKQAVWVLASKSVDAASLTAALEHPESATPMFVFATETMLGGYLYVDGIPEEFVKLLGHPKLVLPSGAARPASA